MTIAIKGGQLKIGLQAATPGLDLSLERWSLEACAEPLAEATGVKLVVTGEPARAKLKAGA